MILFTVVKFIHMMTEFFPVRTEVTINYQSAVFLPISDACAAEMKAPRTSSPRSRAHPSAPNATARVGIFFSQVFTVPNGLSQLGFTPQLRLAKWRNGGDLEIFELFYWQPGTLSSFFYKKLFICSSYFQSIL